LPQFSGLLLGLLLGLPHLGIRLWSFWLSLG
jgi:hypothetical protein